MQAMKTIFLIAFLFASLPVLGEVPARQVLEAWIEAFNSEDATKKAAFDAAYSPPQPVSKSTPMRFLTGGFTLLKFEKEEPTSAVALLQEVNSDTVARAVLSLADNAGGRIKAFEIRITTRPSEMAIKRLPTEEAIALTSLRIDALAAGELFAGVVLVAKGDHVALERAVGLSDRDAKRPISPDTQFRIGSMNKMFTSIAILQLVEAGQLSLDDALGKHLAAYPEKSVAEKVKIRHLLTHSGGTGDIFGPEFTKNRLELKSLDDYAKLYGMRALGHEPGATFRYSNYGYILLGLIIEKTSGMSYYDYVRKRIFEPAGMTATDSLPETEAVLRRSAGYMRREGTWRSNADTLPWRGTSAGGGYSTARDLLKFAQALESGKLVSKALLAEALTGQVSPNYGFGFGLSGEGVLRRYGHGGGAPGMNGELRIYPESGHVVVVLSNLDPPAATRIADFLDKRM
jgi:CubicO group peptidase (beta-lactamase class C family)